MHVHLIGVGGIAMGNLAAMFKARGDRVTGSDRNLYPPMSERLLEWGIETLPFKAENVHSADLIIVGNVISRGNPEVEEMLNLNLNYMSMSGALSEFFLKGKNVIVAAGTHGKTTTTFLVDHILSQSGKKPGLFAGGVRADGMDGFRIGESEYFVIEGDEYDTAFFDKHSKFMHYRPKYLILTSIEFDHADIFADFDEYRTAFKRLLRLIPSEGGVVANASCPNVVNLLKDYSLSEVLFYGSCNKKKLKNFSEYEMDGAKVSFKKYFSVDSFPMIGEYNAANSLAALLVSLKAGLNMEQIQKGIKSFPGVLRRQQFRVNRETCVGRDVPVAVIEDFAHHPTAVKSTLEGVKKRFPDRKIWALFEPRSATSHRNIFHNEYSDAFRKADYIFISEVFNPSKVSSREKLNVRKLVGEISARKKYPAVYARNPQDLLTVFKKQFVQSKKGDVIVVMSNGSFGGIYRELDGFINSL
ncbi:MAG: Mur ligase family protein [Spirochaetia bacterium]|nr:Mur ligase family protein [Spirochaetia bacterium]